MFALPNHASPKNASPPGRIQTSDLEISAYAIVSRLYDMELLDFLLCVSDHFIVVGGCWLLVGRFTSLVATNWAKLIHPFDPYALMKHWVNS